MKKKSRDALMCGIRCIPPVEEVEHIPEKKPTRMRASVRARVEARKELVKMGKPPLTKADVLTIQYLLLRAPKDKSPTIETLTRTYACSRRVIIKARDGWWDRYYCIGVDTKSKYDFRLSEITSWRKKRS